MSDVQQHTFHTPEPVELEVKVPVGEIVVESVDGEESSVVVEGSERMLELMDVRQDGRRIVVELRGKKPFGITISIGDLSFGNSGSLTVRARVPHGSAVELASASADAEMRGRFRTLESKTASGDLKLRGEVEEDAQIKTVSGDVVLEQVHGDLSFTSVSGDVTVRRAGASVGGRTVSGDVRLESTRQGNVSLQSVSGDLEVGVEAGANLDVDANSVSGDLNSEIPLGSEPTDDDSFAPALVVRGKSVSGDFRIFRAS
jgi:DUF4097 and DUF4098 domain-containing protein YvlB